MPAAYVGAAAAAGGLALNIANSGGGGNVPQPYQPQNQHLQDMNFNNLMGLYGNYAMSLPGQVIPQFQQAQQNSVSVTARNWCLVPPRTLMIFGPVTSPWSWPSIHTRIVPVATSVA